MRKFVGSGAFALVVLASTALSAMAQDTLKIGYVDPLSGGGAAAGQIGMNQLNYIAEAVNAKGGVMGKQVEIIPYDNKLDPQVSLVQIQKAVDQGVRIVIQGNGSSVAAATLRYTARRWLVSTIYVSSIRSSTPRLTRAIPARKWSTSTMPPSTRR